MGTIHWLVAASVLTVTLAGCAPSDEAATPTVVTTSIAASPMLADREFLESTLAPEIYAINETITEFHTWEEDIDRDNPQAWLNKYDALISQIEARFAEASDLVAAVTFPNVAGNGLPSQAAVDQYLSTVADYINSARQYESAMGACIADASMCADIYFRDIEPSLGEAGGPVVRATMDLALQASP